jgi:hypothetical protein
VVLVKLLHQRERRLVVLLGEAVAALRATQQRTRVTSDKCASFPPARAARACFCSTSVISCTDSQPERSLSICAPPHRVQ